MVDQRAGGLRGHLHNRGGDRGEQVRKDDADEVTNEAEQSQVFIPNFFRIQIHGFVMGKALPLKKGEV